MTAKWARGKESNLYCIHCLERNDSRKALWPSMHLFTAQEISLNWRAALVFTTKGILPPRDDRLLLAFLETEGSASMPASKDELKYPEISENHICDFYFPGCRWLLCCSGSFLPVLVSFSYFSCREIPPFLTYIYPHPHTYALFFFFFFVCGRQINASPRYAESELFYNYVGELKGWPMAYWVQFYVRVKFFFYLFACF